MKLPKFGAFLALFLIFSNGYAASIDSEENSSTRGSSILDGIHFSGYLDTSYNYLVKNHSFVNGVDNRVNDLTQNGFTLQQASLIISKQPEQGFGGLANFLVGRDAYTLAPYGWNPYFGSQTLGFVIPQAFLQYTINSYSVLAGFFSTLVGEESYNPTLDTNFSRSILDGYAEPGGLLGVRGVYTVNDNLKLNLGVDNGWSGYRDTGRRVSFEIGGTYLFNNLGSLMIQTLSGEQRLATRIARGPTSQRKFINIIATLNATNALTLIASGDYGIQKKGISPTNEMEQVVWQGISGYVNYQINERWRTSVRGEIYDDQDGYTTGIRQNWREITLTLAYAPIKKVELRAETRHDFSNVPVFMNVTGPGVGNNQQSYALEGLYKFL